MEAVADLPQRLINLLERDVVLGQYLRHVEQFAPPPYFAIGTDVAHDNVAAVFQSRQFDGIGLAGRSINLARKGSIQCFMRTLPVELLPESVEATLLDGEIRSQWINGGCLQTAVHALMTPVLTGLARTDALRTNTEPDPPLGQRADAAHRQRGKRRAVIGSNAIRQAIFAKRPLHPGLDRLRSWVHEPLALQQVAREVIGHRQRVTALAVAQCKVAFKIRTPQLVTVLTCAKRRAVRVDAAAHAARPHQTGAFEYFTGSAVRRPGPVRVMTTQAIEDLLRSEV